MNILLLSATEYPHVGGLSSHMSNLSRGLEELGHRVDFLSPKQFSEGERWVIRGSTGLVRRMFPGWFWFLCNHLLTRHMLSRELRRRFSAKSYDIINAQDPIAFNATSRLRRRGKAKAVLTIHGYFVYEVALGSIRRDSFWGALLFREELRAYREASLIFTVDSRLKEYIVKMGVSPEKIRVMPNFVDIEEFKPRGAQRELRERFSLPKDRKLILCPRRLVEKCGVIYLLAAAELLKNTLGSTFTVALAGDGPERERLHSYVSEHGIDDVVRFMGTVQPSEMKYLYNAADLVVIPSIRVKDEQEATSIAALEAMASGVPVIASNIGGLMEIIEDGETGFLVPERDPEKMAEAIVLLLHSDNEELTRRARRSVVERFSHVSRAREYLESYQSLWSS